jgi:hypothetical protein
MKHPILATITTLGLGCVASVGVAQDETKTTNLQDVTVTGTPAPYETYVVDLNRDYGLQVLVGNTRRQYMQAQRAAEGSEALRMRGAALTPYVSVAIDNSSGPGVARQIQLIDSAQVTVAIVNVYCRGVALSGGNHCKLALRPVSPSTYGQRLASS